MKDEAIHGTEKEFIDLFKELTVSRSEWQVWSDLMAVMACTLSNVLDTDEKRKADREKEYKDSIARLGGAEIPAMVFTVVTQALDRDPDQDFLGKLYTSLGLGSRWKGQFFTPFTISRLMAETDLQKEKLSEELDKDGWIAISDPSCGAGSTLIAAAYALRKQHINYQQATAFVGQDIDRVAAQMCYIQISLLGCPGYVVVADTLTDPISGPVLTPKEKDSQEFWYTPMWWSDTWTMRRLKEYYKRKGEI